MIQTLIAIWLGKIIDSLTRTFGRGHGSAAPGYYALKIDPKLVSKLASQIPENIVITGTNGKTTTAQLLDHFIKQNNFKVTRNTTGSNLERGVASTLIKQVNFWGKMPKVNLGLWELDEAAFNQVLPKIKPQIIVILNALRDQLDRYGEVDSVVQKWQHTLSQVNWPAKLILNGSDLTIAHLSQLENIQSELFEIKNHGIIFERIDNSNVNIAKATFKAEVLKNHGLEGLEIRIDYPHSKLDINLPIPGVYHAFDLLAAFSVYYELNLPIDKLVSSLKSFLPAFGRVEQFKLRKSHCYVFLIKNPSGASAVFETLEPEVKKGDSLLLALNDNLADGTDVSWIWDAQFEKLGLNKFEQVIVSGQRAEDLAVRLKYAGLSTDKIIINNDLKSALNQTLNFSPKRLFILPTYTALLNLEKIK